jgi:hypothetical protein
MSSLAINENGGLYQPGRAFNTVQYANMITKYIEVVESGQKCSVRRLAEEVQVSVSTALKAINFYKEGQILIKRPGRPKAELGSCYGFTPDHHMLIYQLYLENPSRPIDDYCSQIFRITGIVVSDSFISRYALLLCYIILAIIKLLYYIRFFYCHFYPVGFPVLAHSKEE